MRRSIAWTVVALAAAGVDLRAQEGAEGAAAVLPWAYVLNDPADDSVAAPDPDEVVTVPGSSLSMPRSAIAIDNGPPEIRCAALQPDRSIQRSAARQPPLRDLRSRLKLLPRNCHGSGWRPTNPATVCAVVTASAAAAGGATRRTAALPRTPRNGSPSAARSPRSGGRSAS